MITTHAAHAAAQARYDARKRAGLPIRSYQHRSKDYKSVRTKAAEKLADAYKDRPCQDCGGIWPPFALDLDHTRGIKISNIAWLVRRGKTAVLSEELDKCDCVCASCHRVRTHNRLQQARTAAK